MTESDPNAAVIDPASAEVDAGDTRESARTTPRRLGGFLRSRSFRWSAVGVAMVGAVSFFGNFATILGLMKPQSASSVQVEALQSELVEQREMIARLLEQTAPTDPFAATPIDDASRRDAAGRVAATSPDAAAAIAEGDFRRGFAALKARADDLTAEAAGAWRDLGALAYDRDPGIALEAYRQAARIDSADYETWLALADLEFDQGGDVSAAKAAATTAVDAAKDRPERLTALNTLAELEFEDAQFQIARIRYEQTISVLRPLTARPDESEPYLPILADALDGLGDTRYYLGDADAALTSHREVLSIRRQLAATAPGDPKRQRDVSAALESIGELAMERGDFRSAEAAFAESLAIDRRLVDSEPGSLRARRNLAVGLEMYGDVLLAQDRPAEALAHYEESLQISRLLMASHPLNMLYREDVGFALVQLGGAQLALDQHEEARATYAEMVAIMRGVAAGQDDELRGQLFLAEALARAAAATGEDTYAEEAREILSTLRAEGRINAEIDEVIADIEGVLPG